MRLQKYPLRQKTTQTVKRIKPHTQVTVYLSAINSGSALQSINSIGSLMPTTISWETAHGENFAVIWMRSKMRLPVWASRAKQDGSIKDWQSRQFWSLPGSTLLIKIIVGDHYHTNPFGRSGFREVKAGGIHYGTYSKIVQ